MRRTRNGMHDELIYWMLNQTECDFAVAAHAFYNSDPAYFLDNPRPPPRPGPGQAFAQVIVNWDKGFYRSHKLRLDSRDAHPSDVSRVRQKIIAHPRGSLPFLIPTRFVDLAGGKQTALPDHLSPDNARNLWPIYSALQLRVPPTAPGLSRMLMRAQGLFNMRSLRH